MGCCCPVETISGGWSMCAAQAEEPPAAKEKQRRETFLLVLRRSHPRAENSLLCKTAQLDCEQQIKFF